VEHRLFGADTGQLRVQVSSETVESSRQVAALGTLLGPEGSGTEPPSGSGRPIRTSPLDEPPRLRQAPLSVRYRPYFENYTVDASIFVCSQVFKGTRWMPWHQEPKKDVGICDKPRGVDNQTVIRGFPNGETRLEASPVTLA
jgi:hypothetical protein